MTDRWQSSLLYCFTQAPHVLETSVIAILSHLYLKKCQTILLVKVSQHNIFSMNTCVLFSTTAAVHALASQLCWFIAWGQSGKVFVPVANGLFVFMMRREDGKVIKVDSRSASSQRKPSVDRPLREVTGKSSGKRFDSDLHPCWKTQTN